MWGRGGAASKLVDVGNTGRVLVKLPYWKLICEAQADSRCMLFADLGRQQSLKRD